MNLQISQIFGLLCLIRGLFGAITDPEGSSVTFIGEMTFHHFCTTSQTIKNLKWMWLGYWKSSQLPKSGKNPNLCSFRAIARGDPGIFWHFWHQNRILRCHIPYINFVVSRAPMGSFKKRVLLRAVQNLTIWFIVFSVVFIQ